LTALIPMLRRRRSSTAAARPPEGATGGPPELRDSGPQAAAARFQQIVLPHLAAAYNLARFLARSPAAADDIVQESFLRAYRSFETYRGGDAKAWILTIVRNCYFNWSRANARWRKMPDYEAADPSGGAVLAAEFETADGETPEVSLQREFEVEAVRGAIEELPEPFRETLVLRELEDLSYKDIARITGAPLGTVMSRLARARRLLGVTLGRLRP
jgi:RNA polymerase sigma-70 factor (ECF subfamily)